MAKINNIYKNNENKLKDSIEKVNLSLLVLVSVKDFNMIKQFYAKDKIMDIEICFSKKLLELQKHKKLFNKTYILGEGIFALICDLCSFNTLKKELLGFFDEFVEKVNESYLLIENSKYDLNIDLSYAIGKYKLFADAKQGLKEVRKRQKMFIMPMILLIYLNTIQASKKRQLKIKLGLNLILYFLIVFLLLII